jgi:hypothetical protein
MKYPMHATKVYAGKEVQLHASLTSVLYGVSQPGRFISEGSIPGTQPIERWVGHRANLDASEMKKIYIPVWNGNTVPRVPSPYTSHDTDFSKLQAVMLFV